MSSMMCRSSFLATTIVCVLLPAMGIAQDATEIRGIRKPPREEFLINAGVRDWGPATVAGTMMLAGGPTGKGGLFAIDAGTGKLKWTFRPTGINGSVATPPAVFRDIAIAPFGAANPGAVVAVSMATGKELWRGPDPAVDAAVVVVGELAYILDKQGGFHALAAATGREVWKVAFTNHLAPCPTQPIVRDGILYLMAEADATAGDAKKKAGYYLFALDAKSGEERWRYRADAPYITPGACLTQPVVTATTIYATGERRLWAVDRATGRDRWASIEVRQPVDGRDRAVEMSPLVEAGNVLVGMSAGFLTGFDKASGKVVWQVPGEYHLSHPSLAVAGNILYFQGSPKAQPTAVSRGTLHALDLDSRTILWSFARPTAEPNWAFGWVTPVDGGVWVDSYQAMVKLREGL
jgi:outer membrane protein assembly factor BamB